VLSTLPISMQFDAMIKVRLQLLPPRRLAVWTCCHIKRAADQRPRLCIRGDLTSLAVRSTKSYQDEGVTVSRGHCCFGTNASGTKRLTDPDGILELIIWCEQLLIAQCIGTVGTGQYSVEDR